MSAAGLLGPNLVDLWQLNSTSCLASPQLKSGRSCLEEELGKYGLLHNLQQKNGTLEKKIIELEKRKDYSAVINEKMASGAADNIDIPARAAVNIG